MHGKLKLSTFVHHSITPKQRRSDGFKAAIMFLPELYAAHLNSTDTSWKDNGSGSSRPMKDELLHPPSKYFDYAHEGFQAATRVEMHILPGMMGLEVEFYRGKDSTGHKIVFSIHEEDGSFGAGFLGGERVR